MASDKSCFIDISAFDLCLLLIQPLRQDFQIRLKKVEIFYFIQYQSFQKVNM